jgi:glycosyltransferase involved in cell wall biosynthesis
MNDLKIYLSFNPELSNLGINQLKKEFLNDLKNNNRITTIESFFKNNPNFNLNIYKKFNKNIENLSNIDIILHWLKIRKEENLISCEEDFHKIYPNFDLFFVKELYPIFNNMDNIDIFALWHNKNKIFKNIYSEELFFKIYPYFNIEKYKYFYNIENLSNKDIIIDILSTKNIEELIYSEKSFKNINPDFNINFFREKYNNDIKNFSENIVQLSDFDIMKKWFYDKNKEIFVEEIENIDKNLNITTNDNINNNEINNIFYYKNNDELEISTPIVKLKLAHIFVHFFKIGGGENYLYKFNKYNNIFEETIFINNEYQNDNIYNYNCDIVYYDNYDKLNKELIKLKFDIIIDHQLYWFKQNISEIVFSNLKQNNIIRIIHGTPIHYDDIKKRNFYYSIELYKDKNSHFSWNGHIKIYKNIGVKRNTIKVNHIMNPLKINIAIVGRINEEKVSVKFFKFLLRFLDIYDKYFFNFYGVCDDKYEAFFYEQIKKHINLKYHGYIEPSNIHKIYLENDILMHPSITEAGATVILEAMSYGLPIICKKTGGLPNAVGKNNFLCNNDNELFENLILINNDNYKNISKENILKILNENNEQQLFPELLDEIKLLHEQENNNNIPNIIHYIFGLKIQTEEFPFVYYLSILSNVLINNPNIIYFHYQFIPYGYWWDKAKKYVKLNYVNTNNLYWGKKKITKIAHKADKLRLEILLKYGGIYMDIDTISVKEYKHLLKYDFVIGIQEEKYEGIKTLYCNAIMFSTKNHIFIKKWINEYEEHFNPNGWCEASVHLPGIILNNMDPIDKLRIKILEKEVFYYPSYNETDKIFENKYQINEKLITLHYWNTYSEKYYKYINNFDWIKISNSLYSNIMKKILELYLIKYNKSNKNNIIETDTKLENTVKNNFNLIDDNNLLGLSIIVPFKIYSISIIVIYDINHLYYENLLISILNQDYLYYLNIELIIIDNGKLIEDKEISNISNKVSESSFYKNNFNEKFKKSTLKKQFYDKNINVKIIQLNKKLPYSIIKNIGIECSTNKIVTFLNFNEFINDNNIIFKCMIYENMIKKYKNIKILSSFNNKFSNTKKIDKNILINIFKNTIKFINLNIEYIFFDKELVTVYFPDKNIELKSYNDNESNLIFTMLNIINNNFIKNDLKNTSIKINKGQNEENYHLLNLKNFLEKKFDNFNELMDDTINFDNDSEKNNILLEKLKNIIIDNYYDNNIIYTDFIETMYNY